MDLSPRNPTSLGPQGPESHRIVAGPGSCSLSLTGTGRKSSQALGTDECPRELEAGVALEALSGGSLQLLPAEASPEDSRGGDSSQVGKGQPEGGRTGLRVCDTGSEGPCAAGTSLVLGTLF